MMKAPAFSVLIAVVGTPALADVLPIDGVYGNEVGCHFYYTGEKPPGDIQLLTTDTVVSGGVACDFEALTAKDMAGYTVGATCTGTPAGSDTLVIIGSKLTGYTVTLNGVTQWGPINACQLAPDPTVQQGGA